VRDPTRVLVVAGHPVIRGAVRLGCAAADLEVAAEASTAEEAVDVAAVAAPDILVLDMDLPDCDALELLGRLRTGGFHGPVLAIADRVDGPRVLDALRLDVRGYLSKADGLWTLGESLRRIAAGERVVAADADRAAVAELGHFARAANEGSRVHTSLTAREREILILLSEGLTTHQIGRRLGISPRTVETHVAKLYRKLAVRTRVQAMAKAASLGLIDLR
jgi:DNA-binding NarL/FixJ family response regulator